MRFGKLVFILTFLISVGCTLYFCVLDASKYLQTFVPLKDRKNITFYIDSEFGNYERELIKLSAGEWMEKVDTINIKFEIRKIDRFEMFHFGSDGRTTIYKASQSGLKRDIGKLMAGSYSVIGLTISGSGDIFVFIDGVYLYQVVKHEIGHVLIGSSWHSSNPNSLMYPVTNGLNVEIMQEEIDLIKGVR